MPVDQGFMEKMPTYRCHSKVMALEISGMMHSKGHYGILHFTDKGFEPVQVSDSYMIKHSPVRGGYYLVYSDGLETYSPGPSFEENYSLVG